MALALAVSLAGLAVTAAAASVIAARTASGDVVGLAAGIAVTVAGSHSQSGASNELLDQRSCLPGAASSLLAVKQAGTWSALPVLLTPR